MVEFLKSSYFIILYLAILIMAILNYRNYFDTPLKLFPVYMAYTFFNELVGYFIITFEEFSFFKDATQSWHNIIIYNIYNVIESSFFYWVYYKVLKKNKHKNIIRWGSIVIFLSFLISLIFQDPFHTALFYAITLASWFLVFITLLYFKEKRILGKFTFERYNLMFWVNIGLLIFNFFFPFLYLTGFLKPEIWIEYQFRDILKVLIVISYSMYLIGVSISKRRAFR